jgi:hypothetical protein
MPSGRPWIRSPRVLEARRAEQPDVLAQQPADLTPSNGDRYRDLATSASNSVPPGGSWTRYSLTVSAKVIRYGVTSAVASCDGSRAA